MTERWARLAALAVSLACVSCTDDTGAISAVQSMGLTDVQVTGYEVFGCGKDDIFHTGFVATNIQGRRVSGVVCSGILKGSTVRFK